MEQSCHHTDRPTSDWDQYTEALFTTLFAAGDNDTTVPEDEQQTVAQLLAEARQTDKTGPILDLFSFLLNQAGENRRSPTAFTIDRPTLEDLARKHQQIDEHLVSIGGRLTQARPIAVEANQRVDEYLAEKDTVAPSGIELWDTILENQQRIKKALSMTDEEWHSFPGQIRHSIDSIDTLAGLVDLPEAAVASITKVTEKYRMRLTPYYTSLIMPGSVNDPIMLQSIPTGEMIDNAGIEIPPVAADHSPARLIDQFYPRVVTIKATNMCAMYCTHCLRIAHIGRKDQIYSRDAYNEALDYIRSNTRIRDVLITGGDAFVLPNSMLKWLLEELDRIDHVKLKRLGTRVPVTVPMRVDEELLDIIEASNDRKPIRVVTQINTAQEITPVSRDTFRRISKRCFTVLNQAVLLKGINDSRVKMWKLCETIQEAYVRPYYIFNCSYRNPQFTHFRVPLEVGRDIVESMYGNISGDAIPRYIATAGGKIPLHRSNVVTMNDNNSYTLKKPWNGQEVSYPDADPQLYANDHFAFAGYQR
ncbi:KamA family radical SAM protein [Desulfofustis glycolicus]|uniref:Lysine 2,3-aminomutase n=1 Tax=Desulfofustis glycolicus DSM 9705 TaxID=1121409 RepID=A0A1M5W1W6_9BACT|nr:KamA family radical SAM protein [Desulfofustis glycolicus]MCB2215099.1 KamA family radical SAM protein [Desulfobulbaceae bacterium]SHH81502.1 lysine 2,3-aminomutase [Desulfofustis glycolicus DSM 9705]